MMRWGPTGDGRDKRREKVGEAGVHVKGGLAVGGAGVEGEADGVKGVEEGDIALEAKTERERERERMRMIMIERENERERMRERE